MRYQIFVSHNQLAKPWVRRFVEALRSHGLSVFFDEDSIAPGSNVVRALDQALDGSQFIVLIVTPASLQSEWVSMESAIATYRDPSAKNRTLIPVILENIDRDSIPPSVRALNSVSLVDPRRRTAELQRLLESLGIPKRAARTIAESEDNWGKVPEASSSEETLPLDSVYVRKRTRDLILANFPKTICDLDALWASPELSFTALVARASIFHPKLRTEFADALAKARSVSYDYKYANLTVEQDERFLDFGAWEAELYQLLRSLGMENSRNLSILDVGIGNGREWTEFYSSARRIVGVDVSTAALESAAKKHSELEILGADASDLSSIDSETFDIYLSLRTYQSTLFDIEHSVLEAARVLKPGGVFVASLSDAHRVGNRIVRGILTSAGTQVDRDLPYYLANRTRKVLVSLGFTAVGIRTGVFEVYVYGRRAM
jgi:SAM-dependent methyltransferase